MRPVLTAAHLAIAVLLAGILGPSGNGRAGENLAPPPIGLAPAKFVDANGKPVIVPGPYVEIDGQPYVPILRRRIYQSLTPAQKTGAAVPSGSETFARLAHDPALGELLVNQDGNTLPFTGITQTEPVAVANGDTIVVGFTDSEGFFVAGESVSGYAYSTDGGSTWTDGGSLPLLGLGGSEMLIGDPRLATDGQGRWYYVSVYDVGNGSMGPGTGDLGLALSRGTFTGGTLQWSPPWRFAGGLTAGSTLQFHDIAIDPDNDRLYVTYTNTSMPLTGGYGQIEVVVLGSNASAVLDSLVLQPEINEFNNGGSSLAVGPNGELYCAWGAGLLGGLGQGPATVMVRRSLDLGVTWGPPVAAGTIIESWFSNPPGSNREDFNPEFPVIAVDRHPGPNLGRVYVAWQDAVEMVFATEVDTLMEPAGFNDTPDLAVDLPDTTLDWLVLGSLPSSDNKDFYRLHGNAGDHLRVLVFVDSGILGMRLRIWCDADGAAVDDTLLASSDEGIMKPAWAMFTLPYTGTYLVEIKRQLYSGNYSAFLRRTTTTLPSVALDHRDIVMVSSPDGVSGWTPKVRVNDDLAPADQSWPTLAVSDLGVHVAWYDRRFGGPCRALADVVLATSLDAGASFLPNVRVTTGSSYWQVPSDIFPNFGDYMVMTASPSTVFLPWTDGRLGTPDVRLGVLPTEFAIDVPESTVAFEGQPLALPILIDNGLVAADTFDVVVTSGCDPILPHANDVVEGVPALTDTTVYYGPLVPPEIVSVPVCSLFVEVTSRRTGSVRSTWVHVHSDGTVPVAVQDFVAHWDGVALELSWRADPDAVFDLERAEAAASAWTRLNARPLGAVDTSGRFRFRDAGARAGTVYTYRLLGRGENGEPVPIGLWRVETQTPKRVRLRGAQPNPFNPSTRIRFELPRPARVELRILDVRGRHVADLLRGSVRPAGLQAVVWNGRDDAGRSMASGVYLVELVASGRRDVARLTLVR